MISYYVIYKAMVACAVLLDEPGRVQKRLFLCLADAQLTRRSLQLACTPFTSLPLQSTANTVRGITNTVLMLSSVLVDYR